MFFVFSLPGPKAHFFLGLLVTLCLLLLVLQGSFASVGSEVRPAEGLIRLARLQASGVPFFLKHFLLGLLVLRAGRLFLLLTSLPFLFLPWMSSSFLLFSSSEWGSISPQEVEECFLLL